jgi:hypothetical protein
MKYYIYISESKIEMLYSQIAASEGQKKESLLGFDLKVLKGHLKESRQIPDNKFAQLEKVVSSLESNDQVGEIIGTKPYIKGNLEMTWASFGLRESPVTFWGCVTESYALALAGSKYNVLGQKPDGSTHSHSLTDEIGRWMFDQFGDSNPEAKKDADTAFGKGHAKPDAFDIGNGTWLAVSEIEGSVNQFEFIAKVLHRTPFYPERSPGYETNLILATPLYVAME